MKLKLWELEALLQAVPDFAAPDAALEQYPTPPALAAGVVFAAAGSFDAIAGRAVADLGCGPGRLGLAAAALGAAAVVGFDVDAAALASAAASAAELGLDDVCDFARLDVIAFAAALDAAAAGAGTGAGDGGGGGGGGVGDVDESGGGGAGAPPPPPRRPPPSPPRHAGVGRFDTVLCNPPFGTRRAGADVAFVRAALALVRPGGAVFSLHKSTTRAHLSKVAAGARAGVAVVAELRFPLPATMAHHTRGSVDVAVDLLRFDAAGGSTELPPFVERAGAGGGGHGGGRGARGRRGR